jgi:hypothetical protein
VILSALDSLNKNAIWNEKNFRIGSVDLLGAAIDNEEVTTNPKDILEDKTNWSSSKSDYGQTIDEEVSSFSNLYSSQDSILEPKSNPALQIYPTFEGDLALGQSGKQMFPNGNTITGPQNHEYIDVTDRT